MVWTEHMFKINFKKCNIRISSHYIYFKQTALGVDRMWKAKRPFTFFCSFRCIQLSFISKKAAVLNKQYPFIFMAAISSFCVVCLSLVVNFKEAHHLQVVSQPVLLTPTGNLKSPTYSLTCSCLVYMKNCNTWRNQILRKSWQKHCIENINFSLGYSNYSKHAAQTRVKSVPTVICCGTHKKSVIAK